MEMTRRLLVGDLSAVPKLPSRVIRIFMSSTFGGRLKLYVFFFSLNFACVYKVLHYIAVKLHFGDV